MAYEKKIAVKKTQGNISQYKSYECIMLMSKPKSPLSIGFYPEPKDPFMINYAVFKTKSGAIAHEAQIIEPDLKRFIEIYEKDGFVKN
jgi:hypothetical protein